MTRWYTVLAVVVLVSLAGCGGANTDGGDAETEAGDDAGAADPDETGGPGDDGSSGGSSGGENGDLGPELRMLQFDQAERYEYETVNVMGTEGNLTVVVEPAGAGEVTVDLYYATDSYSEAESYTVPAGDRDAFIDAVPDTDESIAVFFVGQSNDITSIYTVRDIPYEVGSDVDELGIRVNVTGRSSVAGVECLTYEYGSSDGEFLGEDGCITPELEIPVQWTKYMNAEGDVRASIRLVAYERY